jgi:hypothetical protein
MSDPRQADLAVPDEEPPDADFDPLEPESFDFDSDFDSDFDDPEEPEPESEELDELESFDFSLVEVFEELRLSVL